MLHWDPNKRASAEQMLKSKWFEMEPDYNTKQQNSTDEKIVDLEEYAQDAYYYKQEMAKLTDGSENEVADGEI